MMKSFNNNIVRRRDNGFISVKHMVRKGSSVVVLREGWLDGWFGLDRASHQFEQHISGNRSLINIYNRSVHTFLRLYI
jgi:hypothetical protein